VIYLTECSKSGEQLIKTISRFLENMPKWIKPTFIEETKSGFKLENNNIFYVISYPYKKMIPFDYIIINSFSTFNKHKKDLIRRMRGSINSLNRRIIYLV